MKIGIDISQIVYVGTGVARHVTELVRELLSHDKKNEYILFGASLRQRDKFDEYFEVVKKLNSRVKLVTVSIPPTVLDILWNRLGILPIETFVGSVDVFWSSDWTQPPLSAARGVTTVHDVSFLRYPEVFTKQIIDVHKGRLKRVREICQMIFCDSEATKRDLIEILKFPKEKLHVIYPGYCP